MQIGLASSSRITAVSVGPYVDTFVPRPFRKREETRSQRSLARRSRGGIPRGSTEQRYLTPKNHAQKWSGRPLQTKSPDGALPTSQNWQPNRELCAIRTSTVERPALLRTARTSREVVIAEMGRSVSSSPLVQTLFRVSHSRTGAPCLFLEPNAREEPGGRNPAKPPEIPTPHWKPYASRNANGHSLTCSMRKLLKRVKCMASRAA